VAGFAEMEAAHLSKTSESILLHSLFVFFVKEGGESANNMQHFFAMCLYNIEKKFLIFIE